MNRFESVTRPLMWLMALLLSSLAAGCLGGGSGGGGQVPIQGKIAPLVTAVAPFPTAIGVPVNTRVITVAFTKAMDPATLTPTSITLACPVGTPIIGTVTYLAAGNLAILALPAATSLPPDSVCTVTVSTVVMDTEGNPLASEFMISWSTASAPDTTPPTVTGTLHTDGATNVAINTKVGATFSEGMDPSTINNVNFNLKDTLTGTTVAGTVSYSGVTALFMPLSNLASGTHYTVTVAGGAGGVKDLAGNPLESDFVIGWTTAASADTTAPTVSGTIHANGATNVSINTKVGATFSEGMDPLTINNVNFNLKDTLTGTTVAGTVSYSGVTALFMPLSNLAPGTHYTVTIKGGAGGVKDMAGNPLKSDFVIGWTTAASADTTAPTVSGTIHANGATNVPINTNVGVTFSKGMDPLTITNLNFTLRNTLTGNAVVGIVSYSGVNAEFMVLISIPAYPQRFDNFDSNTNYTATIKGGVGGVTDLAGNPLASDYVWSWTTGVDRDTTDPTVILTAPADLAQGVAINSAVSATFSEAMDLLTINTATFTVAGVTGTVTYDAINRIATFTPSGNLTNNTTYTAKVTTGSADISGNGLAVDKVWNFTTAATPVN